MPFIKLQFRPGIMKEVTQYGSAPFWWDSDYVRFRMGYPEVIGGWTQAISTQFYGNCRSGHAWSSLSNLNYIFLGTHLKAYVFDGGQYEDITPLRETQALGASPLASTISTGTVTVTDTAHGASVGDFVTISGATTFNGLTAAELNQNFQITTVPTANTYTVETGGTASGTGSGGGGAVTAEYEISAGLDSAVFGGGWGAGPYSREGWGDGYDGSIAGAQLRLWSQSNYGEDLIYVPRDEPIYFWDSSAGGRGVALTGLAGASSPPTIAKEVLVSQERHVIAFGCNPVTSSTQDPLLIRFSSSEDYLDWFPDTINSAGDLRIPLGAAFITHQQTQSEILVWTESSLHSMRYVGAPLYYGIQTIANKTTIMGPKAKSAVGDVVYWMGQNKFYKYDGRVEPIQCSMEDYVFSDINLNQKWKVYAGSNTSHNEIFFFYPSEDSTEVDKYVCYNYVDNIWYGGSLVRTMWLDRSIYGYPFATSSDGYGYFHEIGMSDGSTNPGSAIPAYVESGPFEIGDAGEQYMYVDQIIPDLTFRDSSSAIPTATLTITPRRFPGSPTGTSDNGSVVRSVSGTIEQFTELLNIRVRAHAATIRFESNQADTSWRVGVPRLRIRADGKK